MNKIVFLLIVFILLLEACFCNKKIVHDNKNNDFSIENIARNTFVDDFKIVYNKTKEYALITKSHKELTQPIPDLMFFVYDISLEKNVIADTLIAGDVYWLNDFAIRATEREQKAESRRRMYTYDVKLKEYILD